MTSPNPLQPQSIQAFDPRSLSFTSLYMRLQSLREALTDDPASADEGTVNILESILTGSRHASESLASFMYKLAAECLVEIMVSCPHMRLGWRAETILRHSASSTAGQACLASAQALGSLPLDIDSPDTVFEDSGWQPPLANLDDFLRRLGIRPGHSRWAGRSLVIQDTATDRTLVVKLSATQQGRRALLNEARWMRQLRSECHGIPDRFDIPRVRTVSGAPLFVPEGLGHRWPLPAWLTGCDNLTALAFETGPDYFAYPNDPSRLPIQSGDQICECLGRASRLFGHLTGRGILHTAPIPLFHNRTQQTRRDDQGAYLWQRGGRLDRWLWSCRFPNFGLSGLRDFEHFRCLNGQQGELFREAGTQVLSLALVAGSCFRLQQPSRFGLDSDGRPLDMRHLFDADLLEELLRSIACGYFEGFVGRPVEAGLIPSYKELSRRMIEEMGIDRNMIEVLRLEDQEAMSRQAFEAFLVERGVPERQAAETEQNVRELELSTGPHLGGFNQRISLPELIEFTAGTAARAIVGAYLDQRSPHSSQP